MTSIADLCQVLPLIAQYRHAEPHQLLLSAALQMQPHKQLIAEQIHLRQKFAAKLPTWAENPQLLFPKKVSAEQASSEKAAAYKSALLYGKVLDGSGGMGIDAYYAAQTASHIDYVEQDAFLCELLEYNKTILNTPHIGVHHSTLEDFLTTHPSLQWDCIYLDPARRDDTGKRVVDLRHCSPNVPLLLPVLQQRCRRLLLKTAPFLDISQALSLLPHTCEVHIIQWKQEVRELLFVLDFEQSTNAATPLRLRAVALEGKQVPLQWKNNEPPPYGELSAFAYIPAPALMKSGDFGGIARHYGIHKIAPFTHLYSSETPVEDFMGLVLQVKMHLAYKELPQLLQNQAIRQANIIVKNAPLTNEQICKKHRIKEGGSDFLVFFSDASGAVRVLWGEQ